MPPSPTPPPLGLSPAEWAALRRAARQLRRWHELLYGDAQGRYISRDERGRPRLHEAAGCSRPVPDREAEALVVIAAICEKKGIYYYQQQDPRGPALYISTTPLSLADYARGVPVV